MKAMTKLTTMILALFLATTSFGQITIGTKAGVTYSNMSSGALAFDFLDGILPKTKRMAGYQFGVTAEMPISDQLSFMTGANYMNKGFSIRENIVIGGELQLPLGATINARMNYFEVPLALKYAFGEQGGVRPYIVGGATAGYAMGAKLETKARVIVPINIANIPIGLNSGLYNRFEIGAMAGAGVEIPTANGKIMLEAQYTQGLTSLINTPIVNVNAKHTSLGVTVGYAHRFGGGSKYGA